MKEYLAQYFERFAVPESAQEYVLAAHEVGQSRSVKSAPGKSVVGQHFSQKCAGTRDFESTTGEAAALWYWDYDPDVYYYWVQPPALNIPRHDKRGRRIAPPYTPDALLLTRTGLIVFEVKGEAELKAKVAENPLDWGQDNGVYHWYPVLLYFQEIGLEFRILSSSSFDPIVTNNIKLLEQVKNRRILVSVEHAVRTERHLASHAWSTISHLRRILEVESNEVIYCLIANGSIAADLTSVALTAEDAIVALSQDGLNAWRKSANFAPEPSANLGDIVIPTQREARVALSNLEKAESGTCRTSQRLRQRLREAERVGESPFLALVPAYRKRGNRTQKITDEQKELLTNHIENTWQKGSFKKVKTAFSDYEAYNELKSSSPPVSIDTYRRYIHKLGSEQREAALKGRKGENQAATYSDVECRAPRATRAFQIAHVDHTLLDVYAILSRCIGCNIVVRPTLSVMKDQFTGVILAFWLSIFAPSRANLGMLIRNCAVNYGCIPETIHSDRGSDLQASFAETMAAFFEYDHSYSPVADARYNSQVERYFSSQNDKLIGRHRENCIEYDRRSFSKGFAPHQSAVLTIPELYEEICIFVESHNRTPISIDLDEPIAKLLACRERSGVSGKAVRVDDELLVATSPPLVKEKWRVKQKGSLFIDELDFYSTELISYAGRKRDINPRRDPANPYIMYARVRGKWIACKASRAATFRSLGVPEQFKQAVIVPKTRPVRDSLKRVSAKELALALYQADIERKEIEEHSSAQPEHLNAEGLKDEFLERLASISVEDAASWEW